MEQHIGSVQEQINQANKNLEKIKKCLTNAEPNDRIKMFADNEMRTFTEGEKPP